MGFAVKVLTPGVLFILTLAFGVWLSRSGKPYNTLIFNIHKLIALAAVVVTAIQTFNALKIGETQPILIVLLDRDRGVRRGALCDRRADERA